VDSQVAVKAVIVSPEGKALIMNEKGRWQAPGGRLESGETLREGLAREVLEETGITELEIGDAIHVDEWFAKPEGKRVHIVAIFFACKTTSDTVVVSAEHQDFAWVSAADLANYVVEPEIKKAIEVVLHG
jgi:8-oxo-dGTP diphosphatase